jgi:hypothetical protein
VIERLLVLQLAIHISINRVELKLNIFSSSEHSNLFSNDEASICGTMLIPPAAGATLTAQAFFVSMFSSVPSSTSAVLAHQDTLLL